MIFRNTLFLFAIFITQLSCSSPVNTAYNTINIPELQMFQMDGEPQEWDNVPSCKLYADPLGNTPEANDLSASFRIAWKEKKILLFFEIRDDKKVADTLYPWRGDAIEIFLCNGRGSENIIQYSLVIGSEEEDGNSFKIIDGRKMKSPEMPEPEIKHLVKNMGNTTFVEVEMEYNMFPGESENQLALQIYIDDSDKIPDPSKNQLTWYPVGHTYVNSFSAFDLSLVEKGDFCRPGAARIVILDEKESKLHVFGAEHGDIICLKKRDQILAEFTSSSAKALEPDILNISGLGINHEMDTLDIYLNEKFISSHELFFAPRIYKNSTPPRFDREIRIFMVRDRIRMPEPGGVLFIGSSSIRMWNSVHRDFPELDIIHRGFGGSTSADVLTYFDKIVAPYKPSAVVYYEGDNDVPQSMPVTQIVANMKEFVEKFHQLNPESKVFILTPKPAIARKNYWGRYLELHKEMKKMLSGYDFAYYVDVATPMLTPSGDFREELYIEDGVHMNEKGYAVWKEVLLESMKQFSGE